jgi:hypothetical protein
MEPRIQPTEKYYCSNCEKFHDYKFVHQNWKCPNCDSHLKIKVRIENFDHCCIRVTPEHLKLEDHVTMENEHIHKILSISPSGNGYYLALEKYGPLTLKQNGVLTVIQGGWYID